MLIELITLLVSEPTNTTVTLSEFVSIVKDIVTIFAVILGLYLGHKGIKKYLLDDLIKERVSRINDSNSVARNITNKIIQEINNKDDINRRADEYDVLHVRSLTKQLVNSTTDTSSEIHSLAFLLHKTTDDIELDIQKEVGNTRRSESRTASEFYSIVLMTCNKINFFASNIVDIPKSRKTVKYHDIRKELRKYLSKTGFETLENFQTGLDLNPNSAIPLIFFSILNKSTTDYIFARKYFQVLQNNTPILYNLHINEMYFPLTLEKASNSELSLFGMFGEGRLHLIKYQFRKTMMGEDEGREYIEFTYSNLHPFVRFMDTIDENKLKEDYVDSFISKQNKYFSNCIKKFTVLGEESIQVQCDLEDAKSYYKLIKKDLLKKLKSLKNS